MTLSVIKGGKDDTMAGKETSETYRIDDNEMTIYRDTKGILTKLTCKITDQQLFEFSEDDLTMFLRLMTGLRIELKRG